MIVLILVSGFGCPQTFSSFWTLGSILDFVLFYWVFMCCWPFSLRSKLCQWHFVLLCKFWKFCGFRFYLFQDWFWLQNSLWSLEWLFESWYFCSWSVFRLVFHSWIVDCLFIVFGQFLWNSFFHGPICFSLSSLGLCHVWRQVKFLKLLGLLAHLLIWSCVVSISINWCCFLHCYGFLFCFVDLPSMRRFFPTFGDL